MSTRVDNSKFYTEWNISFYMLEGVAAIIVDLIQLFISSPSEPAKQSITWSSGTYGSYQGYRYTAKKLLKNYTALVLYYSTDRWQPP